MAFTAPLFIPLLKGLDLGKEATLGSGELHLAENIDFPAEGRITGRPARSAPLLFAVRDYSQTYPTYDSDAPFDGIGFTPMGFVPLRDMNGERPAIACEGRLFVKEGQRWVDRGAMGCLRADEVTAYQVNKDGTVRGGVGPDMGITRVETSGGGFGHVTFQLLSSDGQPDRQVRVQTVADPVLESANFARGGTTTACVMAQTNNGLAFFYRTNGADTVGYNAIAINASAAITDVGQAPVICSSYDVSHFFIVYISTTANVFKVLKVGLTGTVVATYTSAAVPGLTGIWIDNSSVLKDKVVVGFTHTGGLTVRTLNHALVDQAIDSTVINGIAVGLDCVVGLTSDDTSLHAPTTWWAYRSADAVGDGDIAIGYASTTAATITQTALMYGGGVYQEPAIRWGIVHQPIQVNGRMYLTLSAAANRNKTGTWTTIDLTDIGIAVPPVATGPVEATIPFLAPSSAVVLDDDSGWTFGTLDWSQFELAQAAVVTGWNARAVLNKVTRSKAVSAQYGDMTVFSGSVPWAVSRGQTAEFGFPFLGGAPGISATAVAGAGAVPATYVYSVAACWRWIDEAGAIHRSAPTRIVDGVTDPGAFTIRAVVTNPLITAKTYTDLRIEVYTTGHTGATPTTALKLQKTVVPSLSAAYTIIDITTQPVTTTDTLYTAGGVYPNIHVPGDGGVVACGRRLWSAGARAVFASKLTLPGQAPGFSDEGPLQVNLPAGAGRIIALAALDELKLVIFCERGVYLTTDGGPSNTGSGDDFTPPYKASGLRIAGPRSFASTDQGVIFAVKPDETDVTRGGVWLLDRQLNLTQRNYVGRPAQDLFTADDPDVAYSPERQQAYITTSAASATEAGMVVVDMRAGAYATWTHPGSDPRFITCSEGVLWVLGDEPSPYDGYPGTDDTGAYAMALTTAHLAANGQSAMGWGRVRSIRPVHAQGFGAHTLTMTAVQDVTRSSGSGAITVAAATSDTTWPSSWLGPEWRLPYPKGSVIQVGLSATPATAKWSAIRLDVTPLPPVAPAKARS